MSAPVFAISPAHASQAEPVSLSMPPAGYRAVASITNPCGGKDGSAYVVVSGRVAVPHDLPQGTSFITWTVTKDGPPPKSGASVSLVLASKQTIGGKVTACPTASPYGGVAAPPAGPSNADGAVGAGVLVVVVLAAIALFWRRRRHPRGAHRG